MALTRRQEQAEQYVREVHQVRGYGPSVREVASWLGVSSTTAYRHIRALEGKGRVTHDPGTAHSLRPN